MNVPASSPRMRVLVSLLPLLFGLHALSSAFILPTLPLLPVSAAETGMRHWAFAALILGFGATQIIWGTLADAWGRRPTLLLGLSLFVMASIGCLLAAKLPVLIGCRLLQGAGVAAAGVCARAMIRDLHSPQQTMIVLSRNFSWICAMSLVGPYASGMLVDVYGANGALLAYGLLGAFTLGVAFIGLPETLNVGRADIQAAGIPALCGLREIWSQPLFRAYTALTACSYIGHYLFLNNSAFLLIEKCGWTTVQYGGLLSLCSLVYLIGTMLCRLALPIYGVRRTVCAASLVGLTGAVIMSMLAVFTLGPTSAVAWPYMLFVLAHAVHQTCGQAAAMVPFKLAAGRASALLGTTLPLVAVLTGSLLAPGISAIPELLPLGIGASALLTAVAAWVGVRRFGEISHY